MARPIPFDPPKRDARAELQHRLERAPQEHAAALLDAYELLQALHDRGMIDTARGLVGSADAVLDIAVKESLTTSSVQAMRNAVVLFNLLASIDPEMLKKFTQPIPQAVQLASTQTYLPGLWSLLKSFLWDKDFRRGLAAINGFIHGVGQGLAGKRNPADPLKHEEKIEDRG